ncbi:hypothetical protein [Serratia quinivorans]|uniref:hypothetical protein n=1 Tax=Serratia quinivorans TaxID=137545 RepID=UPI0034C665EB
MQLTSSLYQSNRRALQLTHYGDHYLIKCQQNLTFLNKMQLKLFLGQIKPESVLIIDCEGIDYMDDDIREILNEFRDTTGTKEIRVELHSSDNVWLQENHKPPNVE